jgi:hypothetical protein
LMGYGVSFYDNPGDGTSKFPVKAWFDNNSIPEYFPLPSDRNGSWPWDGKTITVEYYKD